VAELSTHIVASVRIAWGFVTFSVMRPLCDTVRRAVPPAPVVALTPPPVTVAPLAGLGAPFASAYAVTLMLNGMPARAVLGATIPSTPADFGQLLP
jgi:hypothetical protein